MIRILTLSEVLLIYQRVMEQSGGFAGVRDMGLVESAVAQPRMTFGGEELYPTLVDKAAAIGYAIIQNHPFIDGNKRTGHAVMETFLVLNGYEIAATVDEQEAIVLDVAAGSMQREELSEWLGNHLARL
ncbi:MAG TPA: type II toxin-antitoxin system death-on-curing family toxin [Roseiflexaceae bacterium]|nr:type II toxin-antitoxin system death-on-curing family toxin [Roseiflexaceae bacterium]HMP39780.1 type II toxin-antitoxin system death-on-curing family toxin [Roseiflexaceae bacterium]